MEDRVMKETVLLQIKSLLEIDGTDDFKHHFYTWTDQEIDRLIQSTSGIQKEDVRRKSLVLLLGKRLEKARKLVLVLKNHGQLDNPDLFTDLASLL